MTRFDARPRLLRGLWLSAVVAAVAIDFFAGPYLQFPILYLLPIGLASLERSPLPAFVLAVLLPSVRVGFDYHWDVPGPFEFDLTNGCVRMILFTAFVTLLRRNAVRRASWRRKSAFCADCCRFACTASAFVPRTSSGSSWKFTFAIIPRRNSATACARPAASSTSRNP